MACLGSVMYDPVTAATVSNASLLAMTAMDTTNARITFTAPANGTVLVRIRVAEKGSTSLPMVLLGVLDGVTVRGRQAPIINRQFAGGVSTIRMREATYIVTGLTPGNSYTWDAAYAVQVVATGTIGWGGPNDATASNAYGALSFDIWDTANLLAGTMYDPSVAVTVATTAGSAMTAFDTTNLRLTFTAPASGQVLVRQRLNGFGSASVWPNVHLGVLDGATVRGRQMAFCFDSDSSTTSFDVFQSEGVVAGLTPGNSYTWDAAYGIETAQTGTKMAYGGPNDTAGADAYGGFAYEIWSC